jgi:predicted methyltransferase
MKRTILGLATLGIVACTPAWGQPVLPTSDTIPVTSSVSLVHLGLYDFLDENEDARLAASKIMTMLDKGDRQAGQAAADLLRTLTPANSFGTEFVALDWLTRYCLADAAERERMTPDAFTRYYASYFAKDNFAVLKEYLNRRYRFSQEKTTDIQSSEERFGLLEDLLLSNNPARAAWERSDAVLDMLNVKVGDHVADIAAAPGHYTFRFAERVGPAGRVYASDPREKHLAFLVDAVKAGGLANVDTVKAALNDIRLADPVDLVFMSSYYTIVYCTDMEFVKDQFIDSIRKVLKKDGVLAVLNDQYVEKADTPYRGSFITKQLVISQLKHYGFELIGDRQANPQRYLLTFKMVEKPKVAGTLADQVKTVGDQDSIRVLSKNSLLHLGSLDSFDITEGGKRAASDILGYLQTNNLDAIRDALDVYKRIIPDENFGGEYTALEWFCEYFLASQEQRAAMLKEKLTASYYDFFAADNFSVLKEYLQRKYHLEGLKDADPLKGQERERLLEDFILFNNPKRESWERSSKIMEVLKLKPGQAVADVGCGPGYYTFRFADIVGPAGKVYALDTNGQHVRYVSSLAEKYDYTTTVVPIISQYDNIMVKDPVDMAFLCSLYHIIYATSSEKVKDAFIKSIRDVLKPDGSLVIIDNALVEDQQLPYHGPYIAKELIITQMKHYGFRLVETHQFIPQRYVLIFKPEAAGAAAK